jgi:hypothetical protein
MSDEPETLYVCRGEGESYARQQQIKWGSDIVKSNVLCNLGNGDPVSFHPCLTP